MSKKDSKHELMNITSHPEGGWAGTCSCGRWGHAGSGTLGKLKELHREHIREAGGSRR